MLFIFGVSPKTTTLEQQQFVCPVCRTRCMYELKAARQYVSVFFIKLFPVSKGHRFVQCGHCGIQLPEHVLSHARVQGPFD